MQLHWWHSAVWGQTLVSGRPGISGSCLWLYLLYKREELFTQLIMSRCSRVILRSYGVLQ